jgi:hypothetical protein
MRARGFGNCQMPLPATLPASSGLDGQAQVDSMIALEGKSSYRLTASILFGGSEVRAGSPSWCAALVALLALASPISRCRRSAGEKPNRVGLRTRQQIQRDDVGDHQQGYVDDQDRVAGAQLPRQRWKTKLDAMLIVDDDVDSPHNVEGDDKQPKERTHPCAEEREHGQ